MNERWSARTINDHPKFFAFRSSFTPLHCTFDYMNKYNFTKNSISKLFATLPPIK